LVYVVAQINISAVMAMEQYVPQIQELLRHKGFPRSKEGLTAEIRLESPGSPPTIISQPRYEFQDRSGRTGIVVGPKFVAVHTNEYKDCEKFLEVVSVAIQTLQETAKPDLVERIGLRYVDLIRPDPGESLRDYLPQQLLGYEVNEIKVGEASFAFQFTGKSAEGRILARHYPAQAGNALPPDLQNAHLDYSNIPASKSGDAFLDFDHSSEAKIEFGSSEILAAIEQLHDALDLLFRKSVTPSALEKWGRFQ
jgi:uncharacterized protein (TIGR04255 family)